MNLKRFQDPNLQRSFLWLFYAGFILILLGESILLPTERTPVFLSQIGSILHWLGAGLLLLRIATLLPAYPRYTLTCICLLVAFRASFFLADPISPKLYVMALVMAASHGSDMKVNLRLFLAYLVLFLLALPASYLLGWAGNLVKHIGSLQGSSFGFKSPNSLAAFLALAVSVGLYLTKERRWAVVFAVCWSAAVLTFLLTLSRSQVLLLVVLPVLHLFLQKFRPKPWLLAALPFACLALCGLSPFGQDCNLRGWFKDEFPYRLAIDNGYLALLLCRGVFICLAALAVMAHLLYLVGKKGDALLTAMACCMTVLGMMEGIPFFVKFSFLPLLYVPLLEELEPEGRKITLPVAFVLAFSILTFMFMGRHPGPGRIRADGHRSRKFLRLRGEPSARASRFRPGRIRRSPVRYPGAWLLPGRGLPVGRRIRAVCRRLHSPAGGVPVPGEPLLQDPFCRHAGKDAPVPLWSLPPAAHPLPPEGLHLEQYGILAGLLAPTACRRTGARRHFRL